MIWCTAHILHPGHFVRMSFKVWLFTATLSALKHNFCVLHQVLFNVDVHQSAWQWDTSPKCHKTSLLTIMLWYAWPLYNFFPMSGCLCVKHVRTIRSWSAVVFRCFSCWILASAPIREAIHACMYVYYYDVLGYHTEIKHTQVYHTIYHGTIHIIIIYVHAVWFGLLTHFPPTAVISFNTQFVHSNAYGLTIHTLLSYSRDQMFETCWLYIAYSWFICLVHIHIHSSGSMIYSWQLIITHHSYQKELWLSFQATKNTISLPAPSIYWPTQYTFNADDVEMGQSKKKKLWCCCRLHPNHTLPMQIHRTLGLGRTLVIYSGTPL